MFSENDQKNEIRGHSRKGSRPPSSRLPSSRANSATKKKLTQNDLDNFLMSIDGATMNIRSQKCFLIGGGANDDDTIYLRCYNIRKRTFVNKKQTGQIPLGRNYHTSVMFDNEIFIYGGEIMDHRNPCKKYILNETYSLDLETFEWKNVDPIKAFVPPLKFHASCLLGRYMIISGGIKEDWEYSSEVFCFDLNDLKWNKVNCDFKTKVAYHTMTSVYYSKMHQK